MRKTVIIVLITLFLLPALALAQDQTGVTDPRGATKDSTGKIIPLGYCFNILRQGSKGPEVKDLQQILKSDPSIYPEGLVTGNYGSLTKKAVQKLQERYHLSQTGDVDEQTARVILPCPTDIQLTVVSPNGGESWDKSVTHQVTWKLSKTITTTGGTESLAPSEITSDYFWPRGRIDLLKSDGTLVKHIATVNLAHQSYDWTINSSIPNGTDYKIRIGLGPVIACEEEPCPLSYNSKFTFGDESDNPFSITGTITPQPNNINEVITILEGAIQQLQRALNLLKAMK
jgi:peptidoglycan hydrolase-like protein with peptidoglycan-binding domain